MNLMKQFSIKDLFYLSIIVLIGFFSLKGCHRENEIKLTPRIEKRDSSAISKGLNAKLYRTIDSLGVETVHKESIIGEQKNIIVTYERNYRSVNETLDRMMKELNKHTIAIASFKSDVYFKGTVHTTNIDSTSHTIFKDEWVDLDVKNGYDSSEIALAVYNKFDVRFDIRKRKLKDIFSNQTTFDAYVRNLNPYSKTNDLQSYVVKKRQNRYSLGLSGGYAITTTGITPFIGIGLNYSLIKF